MFDTILRFSVSHRFTVLIAWMIVTAIGVVSYPHLIIDAVPDITNIQVQVHTSIPGASPLEAEQRVSQPIELMLAGIPRLEETRSLSRYGLSQVTAVFEDGTDIYFARQQIAERLREASDRLPTGVTPSMGPISTGLGEIFMYTVENAPSASPPHSLEELREVQDWIVKPQLRTVRGVVEINAIGGAVKNIVVTPNVDRLQAYELTLQDVMEAVAHNNANVGAGFIEDNGEQFLVRVPAQVTAIADLLQIIVGVHEGTPIYVRDVASVEIGSELRTGAATKDAREAVLGTVFMLMGENGRAVSQEVTAKIASISSTLPEGIIISPIYNRLNLVSATIATVKKNLIEGALLVIVILFLALGNLRAAIITACVIPLSMIITTLGMVDGKLSANLMSLGALDFGIIVDGAVILVENCLHRIQTFSAEHGRAPSPQERTTLVFEASSEVRQATTFGEFIIMAAYVPIITLSGIEGKMYRPMAITVLLALSAAFVASLTFVPAAVATALRGTVRPPSRMIMTLQGAYAAILRRCLRAPIAIITATVGIMIASLYLATQCGSEFIPSLDEGDIALHALRIPGTSLTQAISMQHQLEAAIRQLPEVEHVFAKIGTAEIATDPMPPSVADGFVILKPRDQWPDPRKPKQGLVEELETLVQKIPGNNYEFTQPIQMRFNELIAGVRSDIAVKIFGDDMDVLFQQGERVQKVLEKIPGASDVKVEQVTGLPVLTIEPRRETLARFGLNAADIQEAVKIAYSGETVSTFFDGDRRVPIVVRLSPQSRSNKQSLASLPIPLPVRGTSSERSLAPRSTELETESPDRPYITLGDVATISVVEGPNQISREDGKRRCVVTANVRGRDIGSFVQEARATLNRTVTLPEGYWIRWGGQFEHLISAQARLATVVPVVLITIFILIMTTFRSFILSLLVFTGVPFAISGGIVALWLRDIPISISAAVGFIALTGVSVLNGLVLVSFTVKLLNQTADTAEAANTTEAIVETAVSRLRPVLMTALVASLGFMPMAVSQGAGSEVQRPLATVVIGGIVSSTTLTLLVLPILLSMVKRKRQ